MRAERDHIEKHTTKISEFFVYTIINVFTLFSHEVVVLKREKEIDRRVRMRHFLTSIDSIDSGIKKTTKVEDMPPIQYDMI